MESALPSWQVVETVAHEVGISPLELSQPLYDVLDPDALDALFVSPFSRTPGPVQVTFEYQGYDVTVVGSDESDVTVRAEARATAEPRGATD